ncbi:MAG TPA: VOC family protein [Bdellovibrionota bacterium]|nr:VOC family protein [Bdellovibrionota bacterium]
MSQVVGTYGTMFYVADMDKSVKFFQEVLGLKTGFQSPEWTELLVGQSSLCLHILREGEKADHAANGILIMRVKGIHELVARMKSEGVEFSRDIHEIHKGAYGADFRTPEGTVFSFYENTSAQYEKL